MARRYDDMNEAVERASCRNGFVPFHDHIHLYSLDLNAT